MRNPTRQRGFTLVEIGVALSVAAAGMLSVNALVDNYQDDQKAVLAAQQLSTFGLATQSYKKPPGVPLCFSWGEKGGLSPTEQAVLARD